MHKWKGILQPLMAQRDRIAYNALGYRTARYTVKWAPLWRRYKPGKHRSESMYSAVWELLKRGMDAYLESVRVILVVQSLDEVAQ